MQFSNNFDLDYNNQLGSHFRASVGGWGSAVFKAYSSAVAAPGVGGGEDTAIAIPVSATLADTDGSETITGLSLSGAPVGATLSDGTNTIVSTGAAISLLGWNLAGLTFQAPADANGTYTLTLETQVTDSATLSTGAASDVASFSKSFDVVVNPVNDAPVVAGVDAVLAYTENQSPTVIDGTITLTDADDASLDGATVQISGNFASNQDVLGFVDQNGITKVSYTGGVLTLTGQATKAQYEAALESVTYHNTSENPSTLARTISYSVSDGDLTSNAGTARVNVSRVNDAPVGANITYAILEDARSTVYLALSATDPDSSNLTFSNVQQISGPDVRTAPGINPDDADPRTFDFVVWDNYEYLAAGQTEQAVYSYQVSDGQVTGTGSVTITINGVNDAPVFRIEPYAFSFAENNAMGAAIGSVLATDVDAGDTVRYAITGGNTNNWFAINELTGAITTSHAFDFETDPATYNLAVEARDRVTGGLTDTTAVTIAITDVADSFRYVGSYAVSSGPNWGSNPPVLSAKEAAAAVFGGVASNYAVSVNPSTITGTGWYDGWGKPWTVFDDDFKQDAPPAGYYAPSGDAWSAYVSDHVDFSKINYVWELS